MVNFGTSGEAVFSDSFVLATKYGFTGSGTTSDTALIQTALEDAQTNHKILKLPARTSAWVISKPLFISSPIHVLVDEGAILKFHDDTDIDEAESVQQVHTSKLWACGMFQIIDGSADGSIFEFYGTLTTNNNEVADNHPTTLGAGDDPADPNNTLSTAAVFAKDATNLKIFGHFTGDAPKVMLHLVDCKGCDVSGFYSDGNTLANTVGQGQTNTTGFEGCIDCHVHDIHITDSTAFPFSEVVDFNGGNWRCSIYNIYAEGVTEECLDINQSAEISIHDCVFYNCVAAITASAGTTGIRFGTYQNNYDGRHSVRNMKISYDSGASLTVASPIIDVQSTVYFESFHDVTIYFEDTTNITFSSKLALVRIKNGTGNITILNEDTTDIGQDILELELVESLMTGLDIQTRLGSGSTMVTLLANTASAIIGRLSVRNRTFAPDGTGESNGTTTNRTGMDMSAAGGRVFVMLSHQSGLGTGVTGTDIDVKKMYDLIGNAPQPLIFTDTTRNAIDTSTMQDGFQVWNSDDGAPNWWDGTNWVDATGTTT